MEICVPGHAYSIFHIFMLRKNCSSPRAEPCAEAFAPAQAVLRNWLASFA